MTSDKRDQPHLPPASRPATRLVNGGRDPLANHGFINPPVYHASTVLYRSAADYLAARGRYLYGRRRTPWRASKAATAPASHCCPPVLPPSRPRCSRCLAPATMCWSPTAPICP